MAYTRSMDYAVKEIVHNKRRILLLSFVGLFLISLALSIFLLSQKSSAITRANSATCSNTGATTISCTVTAPTDGNALVAVVGTRGTAAGTVTSISEAGATWFRASQAANANGVTVEVWYALNVSSASTIITINLGSSVKASAIIAEYSGIVTSSAVDQVSAGSTGNSTSPSTGTTATTTQASELWIGGMANINTDTYSAETNSFAEVAESASTTGAGGTRNNAVMEEIIVSATGVASVGATLSGAQEWAGSIATFKGILPPSQIAFSTAARTIAAGTCSGAGNVITVQLQNSGGTPANPTGATVVRLTSDTAGTFTVYSDDTCSTTLTSGDISFSTAENSKNVYVIDTRKSPTNWVLTAAKQSGPDSLSSANQNLTVNAGDVARLVITLPGQTFTDGTGNSGSPSARTAGVSFTITSISATDDYFNVNTGYSGAKTLVYAGPANAPDTTAPSYITAVSFTSGQSTTTLTTTLYKAESATITVTDGGSYGYASSSVTVDTDVLFDFTVAAITPITAGVCSTVSNTITAYDQWDNQRATDTSVVNMTTSGTGITFYTSSGCGTSTSQYTLSAGTANFYYVTNKKQSGITITATKNLDTPTGTSASITVNPAAASTFLIRLPGQTFTDGTGITGSTNFTGTRTPNSTAGTSFDIDIKAVDVYNNLVDSGPNNFTGVKNVDWSGSTAGNAPSGQGPDFGSINITFTNGEANSWTLIYYNATTGRTVRVGNLTGSAFPGTTSTAFTVQANVAQNYGVNASSPQTASVAFNVTVTARDDWNNSLGSLYSAPAGTYTWSTTAGNAPDTTAPSIGTLAQGDFTNGVAIKSVTLYKAESGRTFTASEPGPSTITGTSGAVNINSGNVSAHVNDSSVTGNANVDRDSPLTVTITLLDTWQNPVSGVTASYIVVSGTFSPSIVQPSSDTDANGQTTAELTWSSVGIRTVLVQINTIALVQNDGSTADADGFLDDTHSVTVTLPFEGSSTIQGGTRIQGGTTVR